MRGEHGKEGGGAGGSSEEYEPSGLPDDQGQSIPYMAMCTAILQSEPNYTV